MLLKYHYLPCSCFSAEHFIRISLDEDTSEVYFEVVSTKNGSFWARFKNLFRYLFSNDVLVVADVIVNRAQIEKFIGEWKSDGKRLQMTAE